MGLVSLFQVEMGKGRRQRRVRKFNRRSNVRMKKYLKGEAVRFITRGQSMRKLQVSLRTFRRLCILKGIYPVQPNDEKQASKGKNSKTPFYLLKDIKFLANEPLLKRFHEQRIFVKKIKRAIGRREMTEARELDDRFPRYKLDHLVFERYPNFDMALNDMDDALCTVFLFASYPRSRALTQNLSQMCQRLVAEFFNFVIYARCLRKVFISIKGYYYQAEIQGHKIIWLQPHKFNPPRARSVDYRVMKTFLDFYVYLIGFINFRLFQSINLVYPPKIANSDEELQTDYLNAFNAELCRKAVVDNEEVEIDEFEDTNQAIETQRKEVEEEKQFKKLFEGCRFFISREVPREQFAFVIRCFGGEASWSPTQGLGSTFSESDQSVTHQLIDREAVHDKKLSRFYIQPQWVFDCVNARRLLPMEPYFPGKMLPPHVSPFIEESEPNKTAARYVPLESRFLSRTLTADDVAQLEGQDEDEESDAEDFDKNDDDESSDDEADDGEADDVDQLGEEDEKDLDAKSKVKSKKAKLDASGASKGVVKVGKKVTKKSEFPEEHDENLLASQLPKRYKYYYNASKRKEKADVDRVDKFKLKRKMVDDVKKKVLANKS